MATQNSSVVNSKLQEYFVTGLQEIYWSEVNLVNVLTTMSEAATAVDVKEAFEDHACQTAYRVLKMKLPCILIIHSLMVKYVSCVRWYRYACVKNLVSVHFNV